MKTPNFFARVMCAIGLIFTPWLAIAQDQEPKPATLAFRFECFAMPKNQARKAFLAHPKPSELYTWLGSELEKAQTNVKLEHLSILKALPHGRASLSEVSERIFAEASNIVHAPQNISTSEKNQSAQTEPPPPPQPQEKTSEVHHEPKHRDVGSSDPAHQENSAPILNLPTIPTAFVSRETGWTFEIDPVLTDDQKLVDFNLAPAYVELVKKISYDKKNETWQPIFRVQKLNTSLTCRINEPMLIGTISPPPNVGVSEQGATNQTWFLYVTVSLH